MPWEWAGFWSSGWAPVLSAQLPGPWGRSRTKTSSGCSPRKTPVPSPGRAWVSKLHRKQNFPSPLYNELPGSKEGQASISPGDDLSNNTDCPRKGTLFSGKPPPPPCSLPPQISGNLLPCIHPVSPPPAEHKLPEGRVRGLQFKTHISETENLIQLSPLHSVNKPALYKKFNATLTQNTNKGNPHNAWGESKVSWHCYL